jgi:6-phosphogluconate dehydrogenase
MRKSRFGIIGLGTMGANLLLNIAEKGFVGVGYDPDPKKRDLLVEAARSSDISVAGGLDEFLDALDTPKTVMVLVPAARVAGVVDDLAKLLEAGDLIIDCGNSFFRDTESRIETLEKLGIGFLGVGVSGGERGARHGASIMAGGKVGHFAIARDLLAAAAANSDGEVCCALVGDRGAGHFVKMVHNGIEYALMQSIAEAYHFLQEFHHLSNHEVADLFQEWNGGMLESFLLDISAGILRRIDRETGHDLVDLVSDMAGQKGTGMWTSVTAMQFGVPVPSIDSAVSMRQISARKELRKRLGERYSLGTSEDKTHISKIEDVEALLTVSFVSAFAQGFALIRNVSEERGYEIDLKTVASIWTGGCIIRASMLRTISEAFGKAPIHLFESEPVAKILSSNIIPARKVVSEAVSMGLPFLTCSASIGYLDAFSTSKLPLNLIQAQRDHFGSHTYKRNDREGDFHTDDWLD